MNADTALALARSKLATFFALSWLVLGFLTIVLSIAACVAGLPRPWAVAGLAIHGAGLLVPLRVPPPAWARRLLTFVATRTCAYFPITVTVEDKDAFKRDGPFMIGYEPHSVLPLGGAVFTSYAQAGLPPRLTGPHVGVTSTIWLAPFLRNLLWWFGCRSASRQVLARSLAEGHSVLLVPGGVAECFYMDPAPGREVAYLRRRTGFVRLAMQAGAPLVPVFAFGQTPHYSYWRPFIDWPNRLIPRGRMGSFVRRIGYVPMLVWGWLGTSLPHQVPMHVVVGRPLDVPRLAEPSEEAVREQLQRFIDALASLFERHKAAAGYPDAMLTIL